MFEIKQYQDEKYKIYELTDSSANSWLKIAPERGGIIIGFGVQGEELLFLNKKTFYDADANIRGGIPILFPISGQLENGEYMWNGQVYKMKNHGFARNQPWEVIGTSVDGEASITLSLESNDEMKKSYPFDFEVIFTYVLKDGTLTINQEYVNRSDSAMPLYAGFHPYFKTTDKNIGYDTDAQTFLDYNDLQLKQVNNGLDLTDKKESLVLTDAVKKEISFVLPELNKKVLMEYGEEFKYVYLWTEKGQGFICVEPWMAKTDELNRKEELYFVKPGEALKTFLTITVE
ncbi:aldose epimerase [Bacillus canaveralius]|uniref:Aldose epimerase n=1 Tax=Bacillus canaveralius TaxID=1403243 RepID=A0A2N5GM63_9BACI|nr:aldose epimerase [Bacillus canaveralius]PLR82949.1 aldose epimerase [Bacillus canaveralius]PLR97046.1 aldose epimerase [Bacillus canaveralius]